MSYCRFSDGDVYMFATMGGGIECCSCYLLDGESHVSNSPTEALAHLREHQAAGHMVPKYAIERLEKEKE